MPRLRPIGNRRRNFTNSSSVPNSNRNNFIDGLPAGDNVLNLTDMIPVDDYTELSFCDRVTDVLLSILKLCFIFIVCANIISLILDPTPLFRAYHFLTRPTMPEKEQCETPKTENHDNIDFKHFGAKLDILRQDMDKLREKLDSIDLWRSELEYEVAKIYRKNIEVEQYFMEIEHRIEDALIVYDADKVAMIDYALETAGGKVVSTPETIPFPSSVSWDFRFFQILSPSEASKVIQTGTLPGECFAFHGITGRIRIRLAKEIKITSVTLEHAPFTILSDISSCPRNFSVLGVDKVEQTNGTELGQFTFKNGTALQNFKINDSLTYKYVELFIIDNYGKEEYTCIYRFRVHGIPKPDFK